MNEKASEKRFRFNLVDLLVLLLLAVIVVLIVVNLISAGAKNRAEKVVEQAAISGPPADFRPNLRFEVLAEGLDAELARRIAEEPDNRIYNGYKLCDAYIVKAVTEPCMVTLLDSSGEARSVEDPDRLNVRFTVEGLVKEGDAYSSIAGNFNAYLGTQEIRLGKPYTLKTMSIELQTVVTALEAPIDG